MAPIRIWSADGRNELIREFTVELEVPDWPAFVVWNNQLVNVVEGEVRWRDSHGAPIDLRDILDDNHRGFRFLFGLLGGSQSPDRELTCVIQDFSQTGGAVGLIDVATGRWRAILRLPDTAFPFALSASTDGRVVAIQVIDDGAKAPEVQVFDLRDSAATPMHSSASQPP